MTLKKTIKKNTNKLNIANREIFKSQSYLIENTNELDKHLARMRKKEENTNCQF